METPCLTSELGVCAPKNGGIRGEPWWLSDDMMDMPC